MLLVSSVTDTITGVPYMLAKLAICHCVLHFGY